MKEITSRKYHENFEVLHIGTKPHRNYFIPFGKETGLGGNRDCNPWGSREQSRTFMSLNGKWNFKYYDSPDQIGGTIFEELESSGEISVPGCFQMQGYGSPEYVNYRYNMPFNPPYVPDENPVGIYQRSFFSDLRKNREYDLNFEGVDSCFYLYINKKFVGYSQVSHMTSEFRITDYLKQGENLITVAVLKWCDGTYLECQDKWRMSGIFRDVYLLERPAKSIREYRICQSMAPDLLSAQLEVELSSGASGRVQLFDGQGTEILAAIFEAGEEQRVCMHVDRPILWSAEKPYLYRLLFETDEECIGEAVGFRRIEVKEGRFLINGKAVKIKGVNRHDFSPAGGAAVTEEEMRRDLLLMKELNVNAVRTSHYPNSPLFVRMCDEIGIYLIDEADLESHGSGDGRLLYENGHPSLNGIAYVASMPEFRGAILDRVQSMVKRDYNRPSVIMWSLGNESGYSRSIWEAGEWVKLYDPRRLVHYENTDLQMPEERERLRDGFPVRSRMYPSFSEMRSHLDLEPRRPYFLCEYSHAMGNSPGDIEDYWDIIYSNDIYMGGCIWEWAEHGILTGYTEDGKPKFAYGGDFGEMVHDGHYCIDGLVSPERIPGPGAYEMKNVYRPVRVRQDPDHRERFFVRNVMDFTYFGETLKCICEISKNGEILSRRELEMEIAPCGEREIVLEAVSGEMGTGMYALFVFVDREYAWKYVQEWNLKESGIRGLEQFHLADEEQLEYGGKSAAVLELDEKSAAVCEPGRECMDSMNAQEGAESFVVSGEDFCYRISKKGGLPQSIVWFGEELLERPMKFTLMRAPIDNDIQVRKMWEQRMLNRLQTKMYDCHMERTAGGIEIVSCLSLGAAVYSNICDMILTVRVTYGGKLELGAEVKIGELHGPLPRFGIQIPLKQSFRKVSYYGYGPFESYVDKRRASYRGVFHADVSDMFVDYIFPQENSSHYGCRWAMIGNGTIVCRFESEQDFSFQVSEYEVEELMKKAHNYELEKSGCTNVFLDYRQHGIGSESCCTTMPDKYRFTDRQFTVLFQLFFGH